MTEFLTGVLVLVTIVYAWSTFRIQRANENVVALMRQQLDQALRAYVTIGTFQYPGNSIFFIRIRNTGRTAAVQLKLNLDRAVYQFEGTPEEVDLNKTTIFSEIIESFPPDAELLIPIHGGISLFSKSTDREKSPLVFKITSIYQNSSNNVTEHTTIDLRPYARAHRPIDPIHNDLESISENLREIRSAIQSLPSNGA